MADQVSSSQVEESNRSAHANRCQGYANRKYASQNPPVDDGDETVILYLDSEQRKDGFHGLAKTSVRAVGNSEHGNLVAFVSFSGSPEASFNSVIPNPEA